MALPRRVNSTKLVSASISPTATRMMMTWRVSTVTPSTVSRALGSRLGAWTKLGPCQTNMMPSRMNDIPTAVINGARRGWWRSGLYAIRSIVMLSTPVMAIVTANTPTRRGCRKAPTTVAKSLPSSRDARILAHKRKRGSPEGLPLWSLARLDGGSGLPVVDLGRPRLVVGRVRVAARVLVDGDDLDVGVAAVVEAGAAERAGVVLGLGDLGADGLAGLRRVGREVAAVGVDHPADGRDEDAGGVGRHDRVCGVIGRRRVGLLVGVDGGLGRRHVRRVDSSDRGVDVRRHRARVLHAVAVLDDAV